MSLISARACSFYFSLMQPLVGIQNSRHSSEKRAHQILSTVKTHGSDFRMKVSPNKVSPFKVLPCKVSPYEVYLVKCHLMKYTL